jgi:hypothetical protein
VKQDRWAAAIVATGLLGLAALALAALRPVTAPAGDPGREAFSAERAQVLLRTVASRPHPLGSSAHDAVRDALLAELRRLGLEATVQETTAVNGAWGRRWGGAFSAGRVQNVVARLPGQETGRALLLCAHYDSVPHGPGAGDDGSGVVTILETLRALRSGPPLRNDVIALFTDGEEAGLLGARAFVDEHPWVHEVGLVLNFDSRGDHGPVLMFETSPGSGPLLRALVAAAPRPVASSLFQELYKLLPNDTDFTVLAEAGLPGLNFANIEGIVSYHTRLDTPERFSRDTLQHFGSYALSLTRYFGDRALGSKPAGEAVFFNVLGPILAVYSPSLARVFAGLTLLGLVLLAAVLQRSGDVSAARSGAGALGFLVGLLLAAVATGLTWGLIHRLSYPSMILGDVYHSAPYVFALAFLSLAVSCWLQQKLVARLGLENAALGALAWWGLGLAATAWKMPGASYVFTWPLVGALGALALVAGRSGSSFTSGRALALLLCAAPGILILVPLLRLVFAGLTLALSALAVMPLVLLLGSLVPQLEVLGQAGRRLVPGAALAASVLGFVWGGLANRFGDDQPRPDNLAYALDADAKNAAWVSTDAAADEWTGCLLRSPQRGLRFAEYLPTAPENSPLLPRQMLESPASALPLAGPDVETLQDQVRPDGRVLKLRIRSLRGAMAVSVHLDPSVEVASAAIDGRAVRGAPARGWAFRYWAPRPEGFALTLELRSPGPVTLTVADHSDALPDLPECAPRPRGTMPPPFLGFLQDSTLVRRSFRF